MLLVVFGIEYTYSTLLLLAYIFFFFGMHGNITGRSAYFLEKKLRTSKNLLQFQCGILVSIIDLFRTQELRCFRYYCSHFIFQYRYTGVFSYRFLR